MTSCSVANVDFLLFDFCFLRVTAATAVTRLSHHNSVRLFVCPSLCHTGGSVKSGAS